MYGVSMVLAWVKANTKKVVAGAVAAVLIVPVLGSALGGGESFFIGVTAPGADDEITVFVGNDPGLVGGCPDEAHVEIQRDGRTVYPSVLGQIDLEDCQGSIDIPYRRFADRNGYYELTARMGDNVGETGFNVEKVVNWVYIRSFPNGTAERTRVEVGLARAQAQPIHSSVFTSGDLVLDVYWEDCSQRGALGFGLLKDTEDCRADHDHVFHEEIPLNTTAVTNVILPWDNFESSKFDSENPDEGWYNVTATFHNAEAKGNRNVPMDPTVFDEDPSGNWFEVAYE